MPDRPKKQSQNREKSTPATRELPHLPASASDLPASTRDVLLEKLLIEDLSFTGIDVSAQRIDTLTISHTILDRVSFANCEISSLRLRDVRLISCDLSNCMLRGFEATRVEFIDCRMVGMITSACRWQSVLLENCDARFAQLSDGRIRRSEFRKTRLEEAVLTHADLGETRLAGSELRRADLTGSRLSGLDLRTSEIEGIQLAIEDLRGAIVTPAQALDLARLLGLVIE